MVVCRILSPHWSSFVASSTEAVISPFCLSPPVINFSCEMMFLLEFKADTHIRWLAKNRELTGDRGHSEAGVPP